MLKLSDHVYYFEKDGYFALWNALNFCKSYGGDTLKEVFFSLKSYKTPIGLNELQKYPAPIIAEFINNKYLCDISYEENSIFIDQLAKSEKITIRNLVLLITNDCNFNCAYCQIEKNIKKSNKLLINMSQAVADKAIALFKRHADKNSKKTVTITGGEPLLNPEVLSHVICSATQELDNHRIVLFTNGSLLTQELIDLFKKYNVLVLLSLDGPEKMHDLARTDKNGRGTYAKVIEAYNQLKKHDIEIGISAVGGKHNIENLETLSDFFLKLSPASIGLNFSHHLLQQKNPMEIPVDEFGKALVSFYKIMREKNIFVENISRIIESFASNKARLHECQAEGTGFTVDARGKVGPCKSLLVSDVYSLDIDKITSLDKNEIFLDWNKRTPLRFFSCQHCPSVMLCGGGCAYDSYIINNGVFKKVDQRVCKYQNYVLEFLIWDLLDSLKIKAMQKMIYTPTVEEQTTSFKKHYDINNELQRSVGHEVQ